MKYRIAVKKVDLEDTYIGGSVIPKDMMIKMRDSRVYNLFARIFLCINIFVFFYIIASVVLIFLSPILDLGFEKVMEHQILKRNIKLILIFAIIILAIKIVYPAYNTFRKVNFPKHFKNYRFDYFIIYNGKEETLRHELKHITMGDFDDNQTFRDSVKSFLWDHFEWIIGSRSKEINIPDFNITYIEDD